MGLVKPGPRGSRPPPRTPALAPRGAPRPHSPRPICGSENPRRRAPRARPPRRSSRRRDRSAISAEPERLVSACSAASANGSSKARERRADRRSAASGWATWVTPRTSDEAGAELALGPGEHRIERLRLQRDEFSRRRRRDSRRDRSRRSGDFRAGLVHRPRDAVDRRIGEPGRGMVAGSIVCALRAPFCGDARGDARVGAASGVLPGVCAMRPSSFSAHRPSLLRPTPSR